ncbi:MAG: molybdate ABC transporter permease subunit [Myxococcales bacterium]|nr:molybdate ABC transporter permease subunit [Myxococcales bacterium]
MTAWVLTLQVVGLAMLWVLPLGALLGLVLARVTRPWVRALDALVVLPLVLPPSVTGYLLLRLLGRRGLVGRWLERAFDWRLVFTQSAAVIAVAVVALPLMAKGVEGAVRRVDPQLEEMARVHGLSQWACWWRVTLPLARPGLVGAALLAGLRALGEFGATLVFAGYVPGETATVPLEIYMALQTGRDALARGLVLSLSGVSALATLAITAWSRRERLASH